MVNLTILIFVFQTFKSRESREACYVGQEISSKSYNWRKSSAANASQYNDTGVGRSDMTEISFELMNRKMGTEYEGITKTVEFKARFKNIWVKSETK